MPETYLLLNIAALAILTPIVLVARPAIRAIAVSILVICALTAIFDPIIIGLDIVDYDPSKILGIRWFGAPIEDFFYALAAPFIVAGLWRIVGDRHAKKSS